MVHAVSFMTTDLMLFFDAPPYRWNEMVFGPSLLSTHGEFTQTRNTECLMRLFLNAYRQPPPTTAKDAEPCILY